MSNSADKRSPSTDALDTLGMVHFKPEFRDAIHLAVEPVEAMFTMNPGAHIGIINGNAWPAGEIIEGVKIPFHGIVDPFLPRPVKRGERFWFVMNPRQVQSLRHVWEHPDFPKGE